MITICAGGFVCTNPAGASRLSVVVPDEVAENVAVARYITAVNG
jgi:hypothetical protein